MTRASRLRHLVSLLRPYRVRVALMFVALLLATAAALAPPYLAGLAIDDGIKNGDTKALTIIVLAFLAAALINWGATYAQTFLINWVGQRALQDLRIELFQHLQKLSIGFYSRNKAGVLISRITNDVQALDQLVTEGISTLFSATLTLFGTAVILVLLDAELALVTFLCFPVLLVGSVAFRLASAGAYALTRVKIAQVTAYLQETLSGVRVVRAFGQEERHKVRFARAERRAPRGEHEDRLPERGVLPGGGVPVGGRDRGDPAVRREPGGRRGAQHRRARLVRLLSGELLRPDPVAVAAVHDLPGRHGRARQDLRAARREAGHRRQAATRSSCRGCAERSASRT